MRILGWVLGGMLLAAVVHVALMSPGERARILRIAPTPEAPASPAQDTGRDDFPDAMEPDTRPGRTAVAGVEDGVRDAGTPAAPLAGLAMPVQGIRPAELSPTFEDARSGGRVHEALDIMAPAGTPVLAVADGHVEKLFDSRQGGLTLYQFEPSGRYAYYYAHLERYAPGLAEGQAVQRGQVLGYVGSSGNADPAAPHLHFAIFALGPERRWWEGTPIDPYPLLAVPSPQR